MAPLEILTWIVGTAVAIVGIYGTIAGAQKALSDARATKRPPTAYEALDQRVRYLEERDIEKDSEIQRLRSHVRRLAGVVGREVVVILDWIDGGAKPPPPTHEASVVRDLIRDVTDDAR